MAPTIKVTTAPARDDNDGGSALSAGRLFARSTSAGLVLCAVAGCVSHQEYRKLQNALQTIETERDRLSQELATLRSDWEKLQDKDASAALVAELRSGLVESQGRCAEAENRASHWVGEAQRLKAERDALRASIQSLERGKAEAEHQLDQCKTLLANALHGPAYVAVGDGHWVKEKIGRGEYIMLEDGSLWEISRLDRIDTALWLNTENIVVIENTSGLLPYKLINTDTGDVVEAKYLGTR